MIEQRQIEDDSVLGLLSQGYSVFPIVRGTKRPMVAWGRYQESLPEPSLVNAWLKAWPGCSWAIACGPVSRLVVVDVDPRHGGDKTMTEYPALPPTVVSGRGDGGYHTYIRTPEAISSRNSLLPGVDLKGVGSFVVAPGSTHETGGVYQMVGEPLDAVPEWMRPLLPSGTPTANPSSTCLPCLDGEAPAFLDRLRGVRKTRGGWMACCPVHDDREPSLGVWLLPGGRTFVKCFAGCHYTAVREALDLLSFASTR
jgi:hypothetical protein